jgi:DNA polymerase/3'-5' exonuclease PolX
MKLKDALQIAERVKAELAPHCFRIEIAGSIRRKKPEVKDIEIVIRPKPYEHRGMFADGIAPIVNQWQKVKGELPCKYTQRILPEGIKLDLFFASEENWGLIYAIRTGSADYSHRVLASTWVAKGFHSVDGMLMRGMHKYPIYEEADLFKLLEIPYCEPELRNI